MAVANRSALNMSVKCLTQSAKLKVFQQKQSSVSSVILKVLSKDWWILKFLNKVAPVLQVNKEKKLRLHLWNYTDC